MLNQDVIFPPPDLVYLRYASTCTHGTITTGCSMVQFSEKHAPQTPSLFARSIIYLTMLKTESLLGLFFNIYIKYIK